MIELIRCADHVAAFKVSGTMTGDDYDQIIAEVEAKLARHPTIGVFMDLVDFRDFTIEAGLKDLKYDLSKLFQLKRFPRVAINTEKEWMRLAAKIADPLIPHLQMRTFPPACRDAALAWVAAIEP